MLVLSRKEGEAIVVDGPAEIVLTEVRGNRVRVGIEAAANVKVLRRELLEEEDTVLSEEDHAVL